MRSFDDVFSKYLASESVRTDVAFWRRQFCGNIGGLDQALSLLLVSVVGDALLKTYTSNVNE